jgi:type II secretory pathway pseudopilin PulG
MHDIIEHYGKVVVALAGVLAAVLLTVAVVSTVTSKTTSAVDNISYEKEIRTAIDSGQTTQEATQK